MKGSEKPFVIFFNRNQLIKDVISKTAIDVRILKVAQCPSVSGKSTLTYHIGCTEAGEMRLRIYANSAAGFFSQEWLSLEAIEAALAKGGSHFTSMALQPVFKGKSQNNAAFLLAILLQEGLVGLAEGNVSMTHIISLASLNGTRSRQESAHVVHHLT